MTEKLPIIPNSFGLQVQAERLVLVESVEQLRGLLPLPAPFRIVGEGSNILFTRSVIKETILLNRIKGTAHEFLADGSVRVSVGAGENWAGLVDWTVAQGWGGLENLSLIYGTVGAAPIQNIGAYGAEVGDCIESVQTVDLQTGELREFNAEQCRFGYRDSIFKQEPYRERLCVVKVVFRLRKSPNTFKTQYGELEQTLLGMKADLKNLNPALVAQAVKHIRTQKLPNPAEVGNAGSFFKNPIISQRQYKELLQDFPAMPSYPHSDTQVKIPAAWLIQQLGWKGKRQGDAGVSTMHALVLVNYGKASGSELKELAWDIIDAVRQKFRLILVPEVNVW